MPAPRAARGAALDLRPREFDLLLLLAQNAGRVRAARADPGRAVARSLGRRLEDTRHAHLDAPAAARRAGADHDAPRRRLPPRPGVRRRIVRAIVGSVVVTLLLFGLPLAWAVDRGLRRRSAAPAPERGARGVARADRSRFRHLPAESPAAAPGVRVAYYDRTGRFVVRPRPAGGRRGRPARGAGSTRSGRTSSRSRSSRDERVVGIVRTQEEPGRLARRIHRAWLLMAALALAIIATVTALAGGRRAAADGAGARAGRLGPQARGGRLRRRPAPERHRGARHRRPRARRRRPSAQGVLARERALTADVTHQLKTPLTALSLELDGAADGSRRPDPVRLRAEVDRLASTIASILALARDTDTAARRSRSHPMSRPRAWTGSGGRTTPTAASSPPVSRSFAGAGLGRALRQILDVLIDNALTHGTGTITLADPRPPGRRRDHASPTRDGRAASDAIFGRRSASAQGHGIGLALARSLTEAEGGRLNLVAGEPTTTFSLFFLTDDEV